MEIVKLSEINNAINKQLLKKIYESTRFNEEQYLDYYIWFNEKVVPDFYERKREIFIAIHKNDIIGISILKKSEQKICTFWIKEDFRQKKIGSKLLEKTFEYLGTKKPLVSIPESKLKNFEKIISTYDWKQTSISRKYETPEYFYNEKDS